MLIASTAEQLKTYTLDEAFEYCAGITKAHYENFPVASLFLPEEKRPYIQSVYAFSRVADDFADELDRTPTERLDDLNAWDEKLAMCYSGTSDHPIFIALGETVKRNGIPIDPLRNLLLAFKRDVTQQRYATFDDVLSYCRCSANPVGRLLLMIFGHRDEMLFKLSDYICTGLQLANFWQDVAIDRDKNRMYLPLEDLQRFDYTEEEWKQGVVNENFRRLMKFEVERTRELFYLGAELPGIVEKDLQLELRLVWFGGMSILKMIDRRRHDVFSGRPALSSFNKGIILLKGLLYSSDLTRYGKKRKPWDLT